MDYRQALHYIMGLEKFGIRPGLQRMEALLAALGHPERQMGHSVHVVGTNGKGSTASFLNQILLAAGKRVGLFTSPHIGELPERFRIQGLAPSHPDFAAAVGRIAQACEQVVRAGVEHPTEFEVQTALATLLFAQAGTEFAVLEAGLGGGLDSTHAAHGMDIILTNVGYDHMQYLGDTLEEIAASKVGILSEGGFLLTGAAGRPLQIIQNEARAKRASCLALGQEIDCGFATDFGRAGQSFWLQSPFGSLGDLRIRLLGRHQLANAALAVTMAQKLGVPEAAIRQGLEKTVWPGRLEFLQIPNAPPILLDGAHNPEGMAALAAALPLYSEGRRIVALISMLGDKAAEQALPHLFPLLSAVVVCKPPLEARAGDWRHLAQLAQQAGLPVLAEADIASALELALGQCGTTDMLLVCGSLYLLAEARGYLLRKQK